MTHRTMSEHSYHEATFFSFSSSSSDDDEDDDDDDDDNDDLELQSMLFVWSSYFLKYKGEQ